MYIILITGFKGPVNRTGKTPWSRSMGLLVKGQWRDVWYNTQETKGEFVRDQSRFRNWITKDGKPGPTGVGGFKAEPLRYHLYVSLACPWANRTLIFRALKNLTSMVSVSTVHPDMLENGWVFKEDANFPINNPTIGSTDEINNVQFMHQIYAKAAPDYTGRVTVPVLWDKVKNTIVSNESADIIQMFNTAFNDITDNRNNYYPEPLQEQIDKLNDYYYHHLNNGVYRAGFATEAGAYQKAYLDVFEALDDIENRLAEGPYLFGDTLTETDWRVFTTLIRFDHVYHGHFKTNKKRIADYPKMSEYVRRLYQHPGVKETVNFAHIKRHYYYSHTSINPTQIVPAGPDIDYDLPDYSATK